jgi:hypothetical protein
MPGSELNEAARFRDIGNASVQLVSDCGGASMNLRPWLVAMTILLFSAMAFSQPETRTVTIGLNAPGSVLITAPDGKRLGDRPTDGKRFSEIENGRISTSRNREPVYRVPVSKGAGDLMITIGSRTLADRPDLGISGPGFTIRLIKLPVSPSRSFRIAFDAYGPSISISSIGGGYDPDVRFAVDPDDARSPSSILAIRRDRIPAGRTLVVSFGSGFEFSDNAGSGARYSVNVTVIGADGKEANYSTSVRKSTAGSRYRIEFPPASRETVPCVRTDDDGKGFGDAECRELKAADPAAESNN